MKNSRHSRSRFFLAFVFISYYKNSLFISVIYYFWNVIDYECVILLKLKKKLESQILRNESDVAI